MKATQNYKTDGYPNYLVPMMVGPVKKETSEEYIARLNKFQSLSTDIRDILSSEKTSQILLNIQNQYELQPTQTVVISRAVRLYYFDELDLEDFAQYLEVHIPIQQKIAQEITNIVLQRIIHNSAMLPRESLPLKLALEKFPKLKHQRISQNDLQIVGMSQPQPGTIENWITDYHLTIGQGKHTSIERGNYLFHNRNAQKLPDNERQHVAIILKSFDENVPLVCDPQKQHIIFPAQQIQASQPSTQPSAHIDVQKLRQNHLQNKQINTTTSPTTQRNTQTVTQQTPSETQPSGFISFSSGHKLPTEQQRKPKTPNN